MADQATLTTMNGPAANGPQARGASPGDRASHRGWKRAKRQYHGQQRRRLRRKLAHPGRAPSTSDREGVCPEFSSGQDRRRIGLAGFLLAVASVPVVLLGIAELLVSELAMKRGYALLSVAGAAILIGGLSVAFAAPGSAVNGSAFPSSGEELTRNLNWVRTVLRYSGRFPRGR